MPATPSRIAFINQEFRSAISSDATVLTRYGPAARDTKATPVVTFFDSITDVQAMADERFALLKADRRKFTITAAGILSFTGALDFSQRVPTVTVVDTEKTANLSAAIVGISGVDYEAGKSTLVVWG